MNKEALINFFLEHDNSDPEAANEYLKAAGIDSEAAKEEFINLINEKRAQLKIENGRKINLLFEKAKSEIKNKGNELNAAERFRLAARNMENLTEEDKKIIEMQIAALQRIESKE